MSLLVALALVQAAPATEPYRALGASPFWRAMITDDFMMFETPGREMLSVVRPARQETELGFVHNTDDFGIAVEHADCTDALTGRTYADRVTVRVGEARFEGCGGSPRGAAMTARYDAAGGEPFWWLEIADGRIGFAIDARAIIVSEPAPQVTGDGGRRRYDAPGISVSLRREDCELDDGRVYADAVTVTVGERTVQGCGGPVLREAAE